MNPKNQIISTTGLEWSLHDPKVKKGLAHLLRDLQAMMTPAEFQETMVKIQGNRKPSGRHEQPGHHLIPVLPAPASGGSPRQKGHPRPRHSRRAA